MVRTFIESTPAGLPHAKVTRDGSTYLHLAAGTNSKPVRDESMAVEILLHPLAHTSNMKLVSLPPAP